jgi:hypothetical protein
VCRVTACSHLARRRPAHASALHARAACLLALIDVARRHHNHRVVLRAFGLGERGRWLTGVVDQPACGGRRGPRITRAIRKATWSARQLVTQKEQASACRVHLRSPLELLHQRLVCTQRAVSTRVGPRACSRLPLPASCGAVERLLSSIASIFCSTSHARRAMAAHAATAPQHTCAAGSRQRATCHAGHPVSSP